MVNTQLSPAIVEIYARGILSIPIVYHMWCFLKIKLYIPKKVNADFLVWMLPDIFMEEWVPTGIITFSSEMNTIFNWSIQVYPLLEIVRALSDNKDSLEKKLISKIWESYATLKCKNTYILCCRFTSDVTLSDHTGVMLHFWLITERISYATRILSRAK